GGAREAQDAIMSDTTKEQDKPKTLEEAKAREAALPGEAAQPGRSRAWLYEIPVFFGLAFALQRAAFPERPGWRDVNPNPYWLGVLLFGLRYGLGAGALSGGAAAGLLVVAARQAGEGFRLEDADFYLQLGL